MDIESNDILVFLTGFLVLITAFYAWVTYRIAKANDKVVENMKKQMDDLNRPHLVCSIDLRRGDPILLLRIENVGRMPAEKVLLKMDKDFFQWEEKDKNIKEYQLFNYQISSFAPAQKIEIDLGVGHEVFSEASSNPKSFSILAKYHYQNLSFCETSILDISPYIGANFIDPEIAALKEIKKEIVGIKNSLKSLKIN